VNPCHFVRAKSSAVPAERPVRSRYSRENQPERNRANGTNPALLNSVTDDRRLSKTTWLDTSQKKRDRYLTHASGSFSITDTHPDHSL
jgi:hypothetical protein